MEDKHLDTTPEMKSDELIKSSVENVVKIPSESNGISNSKCNFPVLDDSSPIEDKVLDDIISIPAGNENNHSNIESYLIDSLLNRDSVISSHKIDFLPEEFAGELALIAPIPPGIVKDVFDPEGDVSADITETDIQEKDKKKAKNKQSRARNGKVQVKAKPRQSLKSTK
ncbi:hypothetical protein Tco_0801444 [Tanacetum coccineum]|uniref:Uncharacterized protein n=1 Tax=Tanacetum coccineum TaxID=301880 RepID=A0ABQ4ZYV8_9ASTR